MSSILLGRWLHSGPVRSENFLREYFLAFALEMFLQKCIIFETIVRFMARLLLIIFETILFGKFLAKIRHGICLVGVLQDQLNAHVSHEGHSVRHWTVELNNLFHQTIRMGFSDAIQNVMDVFLDVGKGSLVSFVWKIFESFCNLKIRDFG